MSLHKVIAEAIEANESDGTINRQGAISIAVPQVLADEEMTEMCVRGHISKLITSSSKKRAKEAADRSAFPEQASLFGLRDSYVLGDEDGNIKRTEALTRIEFESIIQVRQRQVNADLVHLGRLQDAARVTRAIWDAHPDWVWGQVEAEYTRVKAKAA